MLFKRGNSFILFHAIKSGATELIVFWENEKAEGNDDPKAKTRIMIHSDFPETC